MHTHTHTPPPPKEENIPSMLILVLPFSQCCHHNCRGPLCCRVTFYKRVLWLFRSTIHPMSVNITTLLIHTWCLFHLSGYCVLYPSKILIFLEIAVHLAAFTHIAAVFVCVVVCNGLPIPPTWMQMSTPLFTLRHKTKDVGVTFRRASGHLTTAPQ